ncbi:unnamed protein product, partial [Pylaiella littoralis]
SKQDRPLYFRHLCASAFRAGKTCCMALSDGGAPASATAAAVRVLRNNQKHSAENSLQPYISLLLNSAPRIILIHDTYNTGRGLLVFDGIRFCFHPEFFRFCVFCSEQS